MAYTTINKSSEHFNTKIYTGNQNSTHAVTGVGFEPSLTWLKIRTGTGSHYLYDAIRGVTKSISSDTSGAELSNTYFSSFDTDGFTLGSASNNVNGAYNYASWNWLAGTAVSGNTGGSGTAKTYTGSVNTTAGFSIIKYTGNQTAGHTIPHHLGVAPSMILTKLISGDTSGWYAYHKSLGNTGNIFLDTTSAVSNSGAWWNSTTPTSSVFTLGDQTGNNSNSNPLIAYCFAEKQGYSKFGSYIGNGSSTDGTFVYTGFKPAFTLIKRVDSSTGGSWILFDNKRGNNVRNPVDVVLAASNNATEPEWGTNYDCDYLSNGFKWRYNGHAGYNNTSGATYIYMAFAEQPLVGDNNVPCTAR